MIGNLLKPELTQLIQQRAFQELRELLCEFPPADIAEIFIDLSPEDQAILLRVLPKSLAAEIFEYLELEAQETLLLALGKEQVANILNEMNPDDRTAILEELPPAATQKLLNLLSPQERSIAVQLLGYPEESIGRRMTPEYVAIQDQWTTQQVLDHLRKVGQNKESLNQLYVVDDSGKLLGMVRLRCLVVSSPSTPVQDLLETQVASTNVLDDQESAIEAFQKYDVTILPVLDANRTLLGVITVDDILDVAEEEATEDFQKLGGMEALAGPYLNTSILTMVQKRVGWLIVLFIGQLLTVFTMGHFKNQLEMAHALMLFLPLIISSGGNTGSQTSTLIIRALATKDLLATDWWAVIRKELLTGFFLGTCLSLLASLLILTLLRGLVGVQFASIAATVGLSLIGVVLLGGSLGAIFPFILSRLGLDPAVCSTPFVATLVDVTGLIIYFSIGQLILGRLI